LEVSVTNAGVLAANGTGGTTTGYDGWRWDGCAPDANQRSCKWLPDLAPGQTHTAVAHSDATGPVAGEVAVGFAGTDLVPGDNRASYALGAAPPLQLFAAGSQRLRDGVKLRVSAVQAGRVRVTAAFKRAGRTIKVGRIVRLAPLTLRDVTVRPAGTKLRSLRRMLAKAPLSTELTVRTISGTAPVTTKLRVTR
jgi:hypothetical protein